MDIERGFIFRNQMTQKIKATSYSQAEYNQKEESKKSKLDIWDCVLISESSPFSIFLNYIDIIICIFSSYFYAYLGAFYKVQELENLDEVSVVDLRHEAKVEAVLMALDIYFGLDMVKCFLTDYTPIGEGKPVRNLVKIALNYLKNGFLRDFIMWIPIFRLIRLLVGEKARLILFIKCLRIIKGFRIFNVNLLMKKLRIFLLSKSESRCLTDAKYKFDQYEDHNLIMMQMYLHYSLTTFKMVISIFNIVFFMSIFWFVFTSELLQFHEREIENDYCHREGLSWFHCSYNNQYFIDRYGLEKDDHMQTLVLLMYFSFTTLSTVGFGDVIPVADFERGLAVLILIFGVAMFTVIKGNFQDILFSFNNLNADFDDSYNLNTFHSLLKRYNKNKPMTFAYHSKMQAYFDYRWKNDNN